MLRTFWTATNPNRIILGINVYKVGMHPSNVNKGDRKVCIDVQNV